MSVSVQVVDGVYGRSMIGMSLRFDRYIDGSWIEQLRAKTDDDGVSGGPSAPVERGIYRLELDLDGYFSSLGITPFYPAINIVFRTGDPNYSHRISLLITPSAYTIYQQN
jgi:5-hydroxyisourate hydrolase